MNDLTESLTRHPLFAGVDRVALSALAAAAFVISCPAGEVIGSPDTFRDKMGLLLSGGADVFAAGGDGTLLRRMSRGDVFGVSNLFSAERFASRVVARGKCRILFLPGDAYGRLLETDTAAMYAYIGFLSDRVRFLNRKISCLTAGSAEGKLARYLASFGEPTVKPGISASALSEMLNIGRASLYRAFSRLEQEGFLRREGGCYVLPDRESMLKKYQ